MLLNKAQRLAIDNLAATFFEKTDDVIAVSNRIEKIIERRYEFAAQRDRGMQPAGEANDRS